jgi:hypothetical protein
MSFAKAVASFRKVGETRSEKMEENDGVAAAQRVLVRLRELVGLGEKMRNAQREYFKTRGPEILREAKRLEKEFDGALARLHGRQGELT